jgi:hypothetical protein
MMAMALLVNRHRCPVRPSVRANRRNRGALLPLSLSLSFPIVAAEIAPKEGGGCCCVEGGVMVDGDAGQ